MPGFWILNCQLVSTKFLIPLLMYVCLCNYVHITLACVRMNICMYVCTYVCIKIWNHVLITKKLLRHLPNTQNQWYLHYNNVRMLVTLNVFVTKCEKTQLKYSEEINIINSISIHYGYTTNKTAKLIWSSSLLWVGLVWKLSDSWWVLLIQVGM